MTYPYPNVTDQLAERLATLAIHYQCYHHPPLSDVQTASRLRLERPGQRIKNLFLQDNRGQRHFLLICAADADVDLKSLARRQQTSRLGFASARRLQHYLHTPPGCVSVLGLYFDPNQQVELWIEQSLWQATQAWPCHPLDNRQSWMLSKDSLIRWFNATGHIPRLVDCGPS